MLTPSGWAEMGDLAVGDQGHRGDSTPTEVVKISERGVYEVYEVGFDDSVCAVHDGPSVVGVPDERENSPA